MSKKKKLCSALQNLTIICLSLSAALLLSRVFFDKEHRWQRSEYFAPEDPTRARVSFKPDSTRDAVLRFDYNNSTGNTKETVLYPVPYAYQTPEQSLQNAQFGDEYAVSGMVVGIVACALSVAALADAAGVSDPTVVRACKRLGFTGYQDLKVTLAQSIVTPLQNIHEEISSDDTCLKNFAIRAARLSQFSASSTAPPRQTGEILYRFIAQ